MAYRDPWVANVLGDRSVLECALDVHMTATGETERPFGDHGVGQRNDIDALKEIDRQWKPTILDESHRFENAVRELIRAALAECGESPASVHQEDFVSGVLDRQQDTEIFSDDEPQESIQGWLRQLDLDKRTGRIRHGQGNLQVTFADGVPYNDMLRAFMSERTSDFYGDWHEYRETFVVSRIG
jgi:hypothetical protein